MGVILASFSGSLTSAVSSAVAVSGDPTLWYVTRAAAVCAYVLLSLTAILGLTRALLRSTRPEAIAAIWLLDELHPFASVLTVAFVAVHLVSLIFDPVVPFSLVNLLLPIDEPYAPLATSLGVLGLYALAVVLLSSWLRRSLPYAFWRKLHAFSFAAYALVTLHGIFAGTDSGTPWMLAVYLASAGVVLLLALARLLARPQVAQARA